MIPKTDSSSSRRKFLKAAGLSALGLSTSELSLANLFIAKPAKESVLYVGTYTTGKSEGIYQLRFNPASGEIRKINSTKGVVNPSYLTLSPDRRYLYAVNEVPEFADKKSGAVSAFAVDQLTGELRFLNQQPSKGADPCYVNIDTGGRFILVANYTGGNVAVFPVRRDGSLGEPTDFRQYLGSSANHDRQAGPHAHFIALDPANAFAYSCDLGTDKIMIFRFDARAGKLAPGTPPWAQVKPGTGPRHLAFHPNGNSIFVVNELSSTVTIFARDPRQGSLTELQNLSTLPATFTGTSWSADIHVSPDGRFVYCSNRGHDSIAIFGFDPRRRTLTVVGHQSTLGSWPRNFVIDPTGAFLLVANQKSGNIVTFRIDRSTGRLSPAGHPIEVPAPVCLKFTMPFS